MSTTTNIYIGSTPSNGSTTSAGPVNIYIGCTFGAPPKPEPPPPPPELDEGTANVRNLDDTLNGRVYTYKDGNTFEEYWVAFSADAMGEINDGKISVSFANTLDDSWADVKEALGLEFPDGGLKVTRMIIQYVSPPPTSATPAAGATNLQFLVLNGLVGSLSVRGGLYREILPDDGGIIDHWRLHSDYIKPKESSEGPIIFQLANTTTGTLSQFLANHAANGGSYVKTEYSWDDL